MTETFVDGLNQVVSVGDIGAFARRLGNRADIQVARVYSVETKQKFSGSYKVVRLQTWDPTQRRWRQNREVDHSRFIKLPFTEEQIDQMPSTGLV